MGISEIPYAGRSWQVTAGCWPRSAGCRECWARYSVNRLAGHPAYRQHLRGLVTRHDGRLAWTGEVRLLEHLLDVPEQIKTPSRIFVNSMAELFGEQVPFDYLRRVFNVMGCCPWHRFLIVTKEADRMAEFIRHYAKAYICPTWPEHFPHVALIVSVESPQHLDRIETLTRIPAAIRGVSLEPLIEPIDLTEYLRWHDRYEDDGRDEFGQLLDWVIVGCEKLAGGWFGRWRGLISVDAWDWWGDVDMIVRACAMHQVPVFIKQGPRLATPPGERIKVTTALAEFPSQCRVQEVPAALELPGKGES